MSEQTRELFIVNAIHERAYNAQTGTVGVVRKPE